MPPYYGRQPADGLHILKDCWTRKEHLGAQSRWLAQELSVAIAATFAAAPIRLQGFQLDRLPTASIDDSEVERRLERAMLSRWNTPAVSPVKNCWDRLVAFQIPLFSDSGKGHWGYLDLLGVDRKGTPVVIELKKNPSSRSTGGTASTETPLRMILEAASYGIALRKNWDRFRREWIARLQQLAILPDVIARIPDRLERVPLVAAAPAAFWIDWLPVTAKGKTITPDSWESFRYLLSELAAKMLPVSFVSISGSDREVTGLAAQPLEAFPL